MILKLFDRTEIIISKNEAEQLEKSLLKDKDGIVKIRGFTIKKSAIAYIKQGGVTEADIENRQSIKESHHLQSDTRTEAEQYESARKAAEIARSKLEKLKRKAKS